MRMSRKLLWTGLVTAPLAWFLSLLLNFALAPAACVGNGKALLYVVSILAAALAAMCIYLCLQQAELLRDQAGTWIVTRKGLAAGGVALGLLFALTIVAQLIPILLLAGCE